MKQICSILLFFLISAGSYAQNFADYFQNKTLRVDYIFTGNNKQQAIYLDELSQLPSGQVVNIICRTSARRQRANYRQRSRHPTVYLQDFLFFSVSRVAVHRRSQGDSQRLRKYILASLPQTAGRGRNRAVLSPQGSDDQLQAHCPSGRYLDS